MEWGGDFRVEENRFGESERGGGEECWPTEVERHGNDGVKSSTRRKRFLFIYLPRADSVAALRAHPGAEGRKRGAKIRCRPEASLELVALETEREIEIDRDREREISSRAYLYPPEFLARPSPLSLLSLGRRIVDDRGWSPRERGEGGREGEEFSLARIFFALSKERFWEVCLVSFWRM